jgi:hypothetical protein
MHKWMRRGLKTVGIMALLLAIGNLHEWCYRLERDLAALSNQESTGRHAVGC